jgi:hypothetical protein
VAQHINHCLFPVVRIVHVIMCAHAVPVPVRVCACLACAGQALLNDLLGLADNRVTVVLDESKPATDKDNKATYDVDLQACICTHDVHARSHTHFPCTLVVARLLVTSGTLWFLWRISFAGGYGQDEFWRENAFQPFPKVAENVEARLKQYKEEAAEVNRRAAGSSPSLSLESLGLSASVPVPHSTSVWRLSAS